ncbi:MAG: cytochrome ubiquinol oxidase subunit I [Carboxydocellales bacterium]
MIGGLINGCYFFIRLQFVFSAFFHFLFPPITIGMITIIAIIEFLYWRTGKELYDQMARFWFRLFTIIFAVLIPLLINELGWFAAEIGRQPWIVYGILKTNLAASPLPAYQVLLTTILFFIVYSGLAAVVVYLIRREVQKALSEDFPTINLTTGGNGSYNSISNRRAKTATLAGNWPFLGW